MNTSLRLPAVGLLSASALLLWSESSHAQMRRIETRPLNMRPVYPDNHMPGWDWWRIYPYSPYNYGRNPYNPIVPPYYPPYYPPVYDPYSYGGGSYSSGGMGEPDYHPPIFGARDSQQPVLVPHPTGGLAVPPPDAAVIRLYIPDKFGEVWFDGVETESVGTTRYYVTPDLPRDKALKYVVKASFKRGGETVTEERTVSVSAGKTATVDFRK